jgi:hypothetical protein
MPATFTTIQGALKEEWTDDKLVSQLYSSTPFLDKLERLEKEFVGEYAQVPITEYRNGGVTVASTSGSTALNPAGNVGVRQAQYSPVFHYGQVKIEHAAIMTTGTKAQAVAEVIDLEATSAVEEVRKQISRQFFGDQSALIAKCGVTTAANDVVLDVTEGYQALVRDWLHPSQTVDIGTTADPVAIASARTISAVVESETAPTIDISGATVSTTSSHYVTLSGSRSGATSKEANGLRNIISSTTALGGLAAGGKWTAGSSADTTTTSLTLGALNSLNRKVRMHTGGLRDDAAGYQVYMSYKQMENLYNELQNQVRFTGDKAIDAGGWEYVSYNGMTIYSEPDIRDGDVFFVNMDDLFVVTGRGAGFAPSGWLNSHGAGIDMSWSQGTTAFTDGFYYVANLGARRRNRMGAFTGLTS